MKLFHAKTEQQKADDAIQLKLIRVWVIMIFTCALPVIALNFYSGNLRIRLRLNRFFYS
jgi:hypothetical protein